MDLLLKQFEVALKRAVGGMKMEFAGVRTNRPTAKLVEDIEVSYLEALLPIKQLGTIGVNPPREIMVSPWDKAAAPHIAKAVEEAKLGVTVSVDGSFVRISLPALTAERREELARIVRAIAEKARIRLRTERDRVIKSIEQMLKGKPFHLDC